MLSDTGHADVAYELLFQRTAPSWLNMIDRGATTIWEDWEGIDEHGVAHESLNHYSKGAVIRFLHTHTLGLRQEPGSVAWESVVIAAGSRAVAHVGARLAREPAGHDPRRVAHRGRRASTSPPSFRPATSARIVFPDGTARRRRTRARSDGQPQPAGIHRPPSTPAN